MSTSAKSILWRTVGTLSWCRWSVKRVVTPSTTTCGGPMYFSCAIAGACGDVHAARRDVNMSKASNVLITCTDLAIDHAHVVTWDMWHVHVSLPSFLFPLPNSRRSSSSRRHPPSPSPPTRRLLVAHAYHLCPDAGSMFEERRPCKPLHAWTT